LFTVLTGITAIVALQVTTATTLQAAHDLEEDLTLVLHVRRTAQHLGSASRRYLVTGEEPRRLRLAAAQTEFEAARDRLRIKAARQGKPQLATIERDAEDYATAIRQVAYEQWTAGDPRKALAFFDDELRPRRTTLDGDVEVLVGAGQDTLREVLSHARRLARRAQWTLVFTTLLGIGLTFAFASVMMRQITRESGRARSALETARRADGARRELISAARDLHGELDELVVAAVPTKPRDRMYDRRLATVAGAAERVRRVLHDLVDSSRIESEAIDLRYERHDATALVEAAIRPFQVQAAERAIRIRTEGSSGVTVYVRREQIVQVLSTLIEDAVTLSRAGGEVTIHTSTSAGCVRFTVADTGPELLPRALLRLFEDAPSSSPPDNQHTSLVLCRRIVEAHRGRFGIERWGGGRAVWFTIPTDPQVLRAV
jgi:signal transduction histidine kinase